VCWCRLVCYNRFVIDCGLGAFDVFWVLLDFDVWLFSCLRIVVCYFGFAGGLIGVVEIGFVVRCFLLFVGLLLFGGCVMR